MTDKKTSATQQLGLQTYLILLPRCMKCRRGLAMRILSCLSVKRMDCDKTEERSRFFIPYERSYSLVFGEEEWLVGAIPST